MEFQKTVNLLDNMPNKPSKFKTKIGLKQMMTHLERITPIVKLDLKLQWGQVYVIIVMRTYLSVKL